MIPVISDEIVLVKEQQPHWEKPGYTLVAGMVEPGEDLMAAARRELEEETGFIFKNFHLVHVDPTVASVEWFAYTFVASGYEGEKPKHLDAGEKNEVVKMPLDRLVEMTRKRELFYRPRFIEDMLLQERLSDLEDCLKHPEKYAL